MAAPFVISTTGPSPGLMMQAALARRGRDRQQLPLDAIMRSRGQDNSDLIALLVSILMQQRSREAASEESAADRALRQEMFEEQQRSTQVAEKERREQLEEVLSGQRQERETFADLFKQQKLERLLGTGGATFEREQARSREMLDIEKSISQDEFERELGRGQLTMTSVNRRLARAIGDVEDTERPTTKQRQRLEAAVKEGADKITEMITAGGRLAEDGLTQAELRGVTADYIGLLGSVETLKVDASETVRQQLEPLRILAERRRSDLLDTADLFGDTPESVFGREQLRQRRGGLNLEAALQQARDEARIRGERGEPVAEIAQFLKEAGETARADQPLTTFEPSFGVGGEAFARTLEALETPSKPRTALPLLDESGQEFSPIASEVFTGELERQQTREERERERVEREGQLNERFGAQSRLGLRGLFPSLFTDLQLGASKVGGGFDSLLESIGGFGATMPTPPMDQRELRRLLFTEPGLFTTPGLSPGF